jgi:CRISPR-associated protein Csx17
MTEIMLGGCAPTPLAHYLKALGILRLVAEQKDEDVAGRWVGETFVLRTRLSREELEQFFLEEYKPTPIIAPWNGGSGFYYQEEKLKEKDPVTGKKIKTGVRDQPTEATKTLDRVLSSSAQRFSEYRTVIQVGKDMVSVLGYSESPKEEEKRSFIQKLRGLLPNSSLSTLDAGVVLLEEKTGFAPLLGSGWNDGNLDFTSNYMQRLLDLFDMQTGEPQDKTKDQLKAAVFGKATHYLDAVSVGQFSPGGAGGPNASTGFESGSLVNPWDFMLMLEGALLFAGAATRRLESNESAALSYPFTVRTTGSGSGSGNVSDEEKARAEIWMPLWEKWLGLDELRALLSEGRVTLGRRAARDGLDFGRAVAGLGVDRGINAFQRYGFLMRSGKAYLATPLNRIPVQRRRNPHADLINDLDRNNWLYRLRRFTRSDQAPNRLQQLVRRLEDALFALTQHSRRETLQDILGLLGQIEQTLATSTKAQDLTKGGIPPMPRLSEAWVIQANDDSPEFRIAVALAGIHTPGMPMRSHLAPVQQGFNKQEFWTWQPGSKLAVWGGGELCGNLASVLERRLIEADRKGLDEKPIASFASADLPAVIAFLHGETDDARIARLLGGLACARLPQGLPDRAEANKSLPAPAAFKALKPLFTPDATLRWLDFLPEGACLPLPRQVVSWLATNDRTQIAKAVDYAWWRLRIAGIEAPTYPRKPPSASNLDGERLLAALMIPLDTRDLRRICRVLAPRQAETEPTT